ncbi:hypothetical protein PGT21_024333 [Puccinia graminis f. sp. tritici]|uniref:Uncharacterized protein n=1 Tax=Puccinia graminis f. sp. tritici TaxID=56615 RepID=A0A5B0PYJ5_PUCGR|nr:hypothetical protein PGT21_024333 [Puccinia graminis f. sp. tritici]
MSHLKREAQKTENESVIMCNNNFTNEGESTDGFSDHLVHNDTEQLCKKESRLTRVGREDGRTNRLQWFHHLEHTASLQRPNIIDWTQWLHNWSDRPAGQQRSEVQSTHSKTFDIHLLCTIASKF